ncbi:MAG TPA: hypothetical protein VF266_14720, partial [Thermoanaerobaculia bacterium]
MHKVPFARLALAFLLFACAFANVYAQGGCEAPGEFDFTAEVCPNGQGSASSRYGPNPNYEWSTYQWTVTGGTIISGANARWMQFIAGPSGSVEITLSVTGNGCAGTKTHTAVITADQTADIHSSPTICPYSRSSATVMYGDSNSTYAWSITNGTFIGSTTGSNVQFIAAGTGAVGLDVVVSNPGGCNGIGHLDIPIVESSLAIETWGYPTCASQVGNASAYGPAWGGSYLWTAENAAIIGTAMQSSVRYAPDGTGPVTLTVTSTDGAGCVSTATRTLPLDTPPVPQLVASRQSVCPSGTVTVSVANAAEYTDIRWDTQNATLMSSTPGSVTLQPGSGPVITATVHARTASGCATSESITLPVGLPDATISAPVAVCAGTTFKASVPDAGPGYSYDWSLVGGSGEIVAQNGREVTVRADGGRMWLRARVHTPTGCDGLETVDIDGGPQTIPGIRLEGTYCGGPSTASVDHPENYASVAWTIQNGVIDGAATGPTVSYHATSSVAPVLTATVTTASGCPTSPGSAQATMPLAVPQISAPASYCLPDYPLVAQVLNASQFSSILFSVTNGVITSRTGNSYIELTPLGDGPIVVTVDAVDSGGCAVTSSATIAYAQPPAPVITTTPAQHCGVSNVIEATLANASEFNGTGGINWFVRNGFVIAYNGSSVTIQPASGNEVEISVEAFTSSNCRAQGRLVVPAAAGATPPPIQLGNADVCPIGPGSASVPDGLGSYFWSIQNGTIEGGANSSMIYYRANGQGPVRLSVTIDNPGSCPMVSTATVPLRETTPPVIELDAPDICPLGPGSAYVSGAWDGYSWSITNGTIESGVGSNRVFYRSNGQGPVGLTVQVWTVEYCTATVSVTQPLRTTTPPVIQLDAPDVCPLGPGMASVSPANWAGYTWTITNGTIESGSGSGTVFYRSNGEGPVGLTVQVWTGEYCTATVSATQPLRTTTPPVIQLDAPDICPLGPGMASVSPANWAGYTWTITNGTIESGSGTSTVFYRSNGEGPVELTVQVWTGEYCTSTVSVTQPLRTTTPPAIQLDAPEICPLGPGMASVSPANWAGYTWTITNGTIESGSGSSTIYYRSNGEGPVGLTVQVWTGEYCTATASTTQPLSSTTPPTILGGPEPDVCPGGTSSAFVDGIYDTYEWSIQNGTITSISADRQSVMYTADGSGSVVISVIVSKDSCTSTNSITVPLRSLEPPTILGGPEPDVCPGGTSSAFVEGIYDTYEWSIQNGTITSISADRQ